MTITLLLGEANTSKLRSIEICSGEATSTNNFLIIEPYLFFSNDSSPLYSRAAILVNTSISLRSLFKNDSL